VVPFFLEAGGARRFALLHEPPAGMSTRGGIVCVPPFAEEMNKCRRAVARGAREFARHGWQVLLVDLFGCGDSDGEFEAASWDVWLEDVQTASRWLHARTGWVPVLWGVRAGALLAAQAARHTPVHGLLLWQPVVSGELALTQFLRMRVAADAFADGRGTTTTASLREAMRGGASIEVAGYALTAKVAEPLAAARLSFEDHPCRWVGWVEAGNGEPPELAPASRRALDAAHTSGVEIAAEAVQAQPFWQTVEIAEAPAFIAASVAQLNRVPVAA
jgi:exosortase A-associated hydrolase 2